MITWASQLLIMLIAGCDMRTNTSFIRRKYYLHRKVKAFCQVKSKRRVVFITQEAKDALTGRNKAYFEELTGRFRYIIQYTMPL